MDKKTQITETGSHIDILAGKIEKLIQDARQHVVAAVNTAMVYTYYEIGRYIVEDEQGGENRAIYGQELLKGLSNRLTHRLGKGWSVENLTLMRKFFITYSNPIEEKTENENSKQCLRNFQLSWSHYLKLMRITNLDERKFYEIEATNNKWSLKELERQYDSSLYERLALCRNKEEVMNLSKKGLTERRFREFRKFYLTYPQLEPEIRLYAGTKLNHEIRQIASAEFDGFENQDNKIRRTASAELEQWQTDPDKILYKIPFSHLLFLCKIEDSLKRAFYESEIIKGCWSYSELERQVNSLYFERTGLSKDKNRLSKIVNQKSVALRPKDIVKNPMTLEFLGLQESNVVMENDLENAILNHLQHFLLELGDGFCYEATQKRILIDVLP
ncbi:MAG: PDDEXK nuclease domain-containing protein [Bacteroidia bacterium]|nr:PDDEXK nuclease domain-containing protein [Bacteroidia bacterium]